MNDAPVSEQIKTRQIPRVIFLGEAEGWISQPSLHHEIRLVPIHERMQRLGVELTQHCDDGVGDGVFDAGLGCLALLGVDDMRGAEESVRVEADLEVLEDHAGPVVAWHVGGLIELFLPSILRRFDVGYVFRR
jgi:hypothetical protein